jgi:hypothetical protein
VYQTHDLPASSLVHQSLPYQTVNCSAFRAKGWYLHSRIRGHRRNVFNATVTAMRSPLDVHLPFKMWQTDNDNNLYPMCWRHPHVIHRNRVHAVTYHVHHFCCRLGHFCLHVLGSIFILWPDSRNFMDQFIFHDETRGQVTYPGISTPTKQLRRIQIEECYLVWPT